MVLFDHNMKIRRYSNVHEIIKEFFDLRLLYYDKRKDYLLSKIQRDLAFATNKERFIKMVLNDEIFIKNVKK